MLRTLIISFVLGQALAPVPTPAPTAPSYDSPPRRTICTSSHANPSTYSGPGWAGYLIASIEDDSASCPMAPDRSKRMTLITANSGGQLYDNPSSAGTTKSAYLALPSGAGACTVYLSDYDLAGGALKTLTDSPVQHTQVSGTRGVVTAKAGGATCSAWCQWCSDVTP